jgi:hypothetical protein
MSILPLQYNQYYTHFSFVLLFIGFAIPFTSKIKYFILLNSIIVGIVGNMIMINNYDLWIEWYQRTYPDTSVSVMNYQFQLSNFITHTLPMIIALIMLPFCTSYINTYNDIIYWTLIELISILIWSVWSFDGMIFQSKLLASYPNTPFLLNSLLVTCISVFGLIAFLHR